MRRCDQARDADTRPFPHAECRRARIPCPRGSPAVTCEPPACICRRRRSRRRAFRPRARMPLSRCRRVRSAASGGGIGIAKAASALRCISAAPRPVRTQVQPKPLNKAREACCSDCERRRCSLRTVLRMPALWMRSNNRTCMLPVSSELALSLPRGKRRRFNEPWALRARAVPEARMELRARAVPEALAGLRVRMALRGPPEERGFRR